MPVYHLVVPAFVHISRFSGDLSGKMEEIEEPAASELTVTCGCPGMPPLTRFDTLAADLRKKQFSAPGRWRKKQNSNSNNNKTLNRNGSSSSSRGVSYGVSPFHLFGLVCASLAVVWRLRASRRRTYTAKVTATANNGISGGGGNGGGGGRSVDAVEAAVGVSLLPPVVELTERRPSVTAK